MSQISLTPYAQQILSIAQTVYRWAGQISALDAARREKVALYAEEIAATLARAAQAFVALEGQPTDKEHFMTASRELGGSAAIWRPSSARSPTILTGESSLALKGGWSTCTPSIRKR